MVQTRNFPVELASAKTCLKFSGLWIGFVGQGKAQMVGDERLELPTSSV
jgi:hypothetical protein